MTISDFKQRLRKNAKGSGGQFVKVDFHVHLPGAGDYEYKGADAYEKMAAALSTKEIALAVILKHEEFPTSEELRKLQQLCPQTSLVPGAEINVLVDAMAKKVSKDHFFHCVVAGDPASSWEYLLHKAKENLSYRDGPYPACFTSSIRDVAKFFINEGALFIPAHLHQSKPPALSRSIDDIYDDDTFLDFVKSGVFTAMEVKDIATAAFFDGKTKTIDGKDIPAAICVQSSDAHHHEHMADRNRYTWLQLEQCNFDELRAALSFPHRVALDTPARAHSHVVGMHIVGSFLPDIWIEFNSAMNCLIGCKGSGKTSILECLRFVLNTDVPTERRETVGKHIHHILGPSGYVECLVRASDGRETLYVRRADSSTRIKMIDQDGNTTESDVSQNLEFDVAILGWHEIEAVADHAAARIKLVDRLHSDEVIRNLYSEIDRQVEMARDNLPLLQRPIKQLDDSLRQLWALQRKRRTLDKLAEGELLDLQTEYERHLECEEKLKTLRTQVNVAGMKVSQIGNTAYEFQVPTVPIDALTPESVRDAHTVVSDCVQKLHNSRSETMTAIAQAGIEATRRIDEQISIVRSGFVKFRQEKYEPKVNTLGQEEREILSRQIQIIEETKNLPEVESRCQQLLAEVRALAAQIHAVCEAVCCARAEICRLRRENIASVNAEMSTIRLTFNQCANHSHRQKFERSYSDDAGKFFTFVDAYDGNEPYEKLRSVFAELKHLQIAEDKWRVQEQLWNVKFVELLRVVDDDDIEIELQVGEAGFVPIQNLSAGQRCTAVFPLLLRNTRGPLVIDQPEDNLDNRYIADVIAPDLLYKKRDQQFIATSHNANLVVLTDADFIAHADSDGKTGELVTRGFFACSSNRIAKSVLDVLDGGEQALLARQRKYAILK